jgi:hypothetical protein
MVQEMKKTRTFDIYPTVRKKVQGGISGSPGDERMGRVRVQDPMTGPELSVALGMSQLGTVGGITPIFDTDNDEVVDWSELESLIHYLDTINQDRKIIREVNLDKITPQRMADAHRHAGDKDEDQATYLGISVEDFRRIRDEMDEWYEDRHMLDQMEWEEEMSREELISNVDKDGDDLVSWEELVSLANREDDVSESNGKQKRSKG